MALLRWVARFANRASPSPQSLAFHKAIGVRGLLSVIKHGSPADAAAAAMATASFCRDNVVAGRFLQAGALPSLVGLLKRAHPECTGTRGSAASVRLAVLFTPFDGVRSLKQ